MPDWGDSISLLVAENAIAAGEPSLTAAEDEAKILTAINKGSESLCLLKAGLKLVPVIDRTARIFAVRTRSRRDISIISHYYSSGTSGNFAPENG